MSPFVSARPMSPRTIKRKRAEEWQCGPKEVGAGSFFGGYSFLQYGQASVSSPHGSSTSIKKHLPRWYCYRLLRHCLLAPPFSPTERESRAKRSRNARWRMLSPRSTSLAPSTESREAEVRSGSSATVGVGAIGVGAQSGSRGAIGVGVNPG